MKVLYITHVDMKDCASGSSVRPIKMLNAFRELGWEVELVAGFSNPANIRQRTATVRAFMKKLRSSADYDFCYIEPPAGPMFTPADISLMKLVHKKGIPMSLFYRDAYWKLADWFKDYTSSALKMKAICAMQKHQWKIIEKNCDIVYGPTKSFCDAMEPTKPMKQLPPAGEVIEQAQKRVPQGNKLIYVGEFSAEGGAMLLLEAMEIVNKTLDVKLELVCRKPEYDKNGGAEPKPWLTVRHISGDELRKLYLTCDAAVVPRLDDSYMRVALPVKLLEYLSYGLPIVATDVLETTNFIRKYDIGIICRPTAQELADAIIKLFSDPALLKKYHDNAINALMTENLWIHRAQQIARDSGILD